MKFVRRDLGESSDASSGGGIRGLGREIVTLVSAAIILGSVFYWGIGLIVEWTLPKISAEREQRWFSSFRIDEGEIETTEENKPPREYAAGILAKLTQHPEVPAIDFRLIVIDDKNPNAFAIPGGTIAVTTGLLEVVGDDEVALAFVLGHELGHFAQRDHLRGIGRAIGRGLVWMLIFGGTGGIDLISERTQQLLNLDHSRQQESGADQWGMRLVLATYGTEKGSDQLFRWLAARDQTSAWFNFASSHPAPADRIDKLRVYARELSDERSQQ